MFRSAFPFSPYFYLHVKVCDCLSVGLTFGRSPFHPIGMLHTLMPLHSTSAGGAGG